jgi:helicase
MIPTTLFPPQQEVLNHGILDLGFSSVLSLSTGAGKTTLAEMGMDRTLVRGERVAYLTPLKALAEEKITSWIDRWPGRKVGIFTGDYEASSVPVPYRDAEVLICTYERLDGILRYWQRHLAWLSQLGLVVVDEFHLLMDPSRGPRLEGTISRLRRVNPFCRVMGLSATISNHADLAAWLDGVSYHNTWRAVPLEHEVRRFNRLADKAGIIVEIVAETADEGGQTLVFASSRRRAEQIAVQVSSAGYAATHHHAGLNLEVRRVVESNFRSGFLACLVATPTLEMGLNLPCRTVVIADNTRWNGEAFEPLPVWNYLQRAGRAGRPGQDGAGRAILLAPTWARGLLDYGRATPEPIRSRLTKSASLAEQILIEVASRSCRTKAQLAGTFLPSTLAFRQDPSIAGQFADCLNDLLVSGLMREDESTILHPSPAGWVAVRHQLSPATAKHLLSLSDLEKPYVLTAFDLLLHHCWDGDLQPQLPVSIEVIDVLQDLIRNIPSYLLDSAPPVSLSPRACAAGVLMATLVWHYVQGQDPVKICEFLDIYVSDAEVLRQNLVRLLQASADLHQAIDPVSDPAERRMREQFCGSSIASRICRLSIQLEHGLPGDAVYLTLIPGCGGRLARRLLDAGISDLEDLSSQEPSDLAVIPGIGPKRARAWIEAAERLIKEFEPDTTPILPCRSRSIAAPTDWPRDIEPGRLQRASTLKVDGGPRTYWVSGGAEEHSVQGDACDCADFAQHEAGWWCKHRLAVRLTNKDRTLKALADRLTDLRPPPSLAGHLADLTLGRRWQHV